MFRWTIIFFTIAFVAAIFCFGGLAGSATALAKLIFFTSLVLAFVSMPFGRQAEIF